jgi:PTH1 family peptidyl-tRNA hydrolase
VTRGAPPVAAGTRRPVAKNARRGLLWMTAAMHASESDPSIGLVVGLGNPGPRYAGTRHNVGVMVLEELARRLGAGKPVTRFAGRYRDVRGPGGPLGLLVPETFMNESGRSVGPAAGSLRIDPAQVLVVHDEIDLPFGVVRGKRGGGSGGHNGLRSVEQGLGSREFLRIRVGVGRQSDDFRGDEAAWVLANFSEPREQVQALILSATDLAEAALSDGIDAAIAVHHAQPPGARARARAERRRDDGGIGHDPHDVGADGE